MNENKKVIEKFISSKKLAPNSIKAYKNGLRDYIKFCSLNQMDDIYDEDTCYQYFNHLMNGNLNTGFQRQQIVLAFIHWKTGRRMKHVMCPQLLVQKYVKLTKIMSIIVKPLQTVTGFKNIRAHTICLLLAYTNLNVEDITDLRMDICYDFELLDKCLKRYRSGCKTTSQYLFYNKITKEKITEQTIRMYVKEYSGCYPSDFSKLLSDNYKIEANKAGE